MSAFDRTLNTGVSYRIVSYHSATTHDNSRNCRNEVCVYSTPLSRVRG